MYSAVQKYGLDFAVIIDNYGGQGSKSIKNEILNSEKWIPAVRALRAIAAVLTLPVASAVCASAAVVFVQRNASKSRLNIRQVMLLADRAWADPSIYGRAFLRWKHYGSAFLLLAFILNVLGFLIYPLQEGLLSSKTIKTPVSPQQIHDVLDIPDQFNQQNPNLNVLDTQNLVVALTRQSVNTASFSTVLSNLWPGADMSSDTLGTLGAIFGSDIDPLHYAQTSNPFIAELERA